MALSKKNVAVVMFVGFVNYLEWAIVMTSIYPYIESLSLSESSATVSLSLAQSLFPLGQGISQPIASFVVKKLCEIKIVIVASLVIAICGNVTYMTASKANSVALIILGRALAGLGAGSGGVAYGFIGANTSRENRAKLMSYYRVICMLGVMSSTIASATFLPGFGENALGKATGLDKFSAPAALTIVFLCSALILVVFVLDEKNCSPIGESDDSVSILKSLKSRGVLLGLMLFLLNGFVTTWVGYVMPLVAFDHFKFDLDEFGWLMVGVSGTATFGSLAMTWFSKLELTKDSKNGDWRVLVTCYTFMVLGIVLTYLGGPSVLTSVKVMTKEGLFLAGALTIFLTYSMAGVVLPTLTTKYLAKSMMPVIMPYCIAAMSAGKVIAPLLSKLEIVIQGWDLLFMGALGLTLLGLLVFICLYRAPEPEETPLLPDRKQLSSDRRQSADSVDDNLACRSVVYTVEEGLVHQPGRRQQDMY